MTEYLWVFTVLYWPCMFNETELAKGFINFELGGKRVSYITHVCARPSQ